MVERVNPALPISQQCRLLAVSRSSLYRRPAELSAEDLAIMALIDRQYLVRPISGRAGWRHGWRPKAMPSTASGRSA
jgi:putative transposase